MSPLTALLAALFGKRARHPVRAAYVRLVSLAFLAAILGILLAKTVKDFPVLYMNHYSLFFGTCFIALLLFLFTLLPSQNLTYSSTIHHLFEVLPLPMPIRLVAFLLPSIVLLALTTCLIAPPLLFIGIKLGLSAFEILLAIGIGAASSLGITFGIFFRYRQLSIILIPCLLIGLFWLQRSSLSPQTNNLAMAGLTAAYTLLVSLLPFLRPNNFKDSQHYMKVRSLPFRNWFTKKVVRAAITRHGFLTALGVIGALSLASYRWQAITHDLLVTLCSLFIATFVADFRCLSRRLAPTEIVSLRGVFSFMQAQFGAAMVLGSLLMIPAVLITQALNISTIAQFSLSIVVGLLIGTILASEPGDIRSQFLATLLSVGLIMFFSIPWLSAFDEVQISLGKILCCLVGMVACYRIEQKRNNFIWTKIHDV